MGSSLLRWRIPILTGNWKSALPAEFRFYSRMLERKLTPHFNPSYKKRISLKVNSNPSITLQIRITQWPSEICWSKGKLLISLSIQQRVYKWSDWGTWSSNSTKSFGFTSPQSWGTRITSLRSLQKSYSSILWLRWRDWRISSSELW